MPSSVPFTQPKPFDGLSPVARSNELPLFVLFLTVQVATTASSIFAVCTTPMYPRKWQRSKMSSQGPNDDRNGGGSFGVNSDGGRYDDFGECLRPQLFFGDSGLTVIQADSRLKVTSLLPHLASQTSRKNIPSSRFIS